MVSGFTPEPRGRYTPGGELMQAQKLDQYTVRYTFAEPFLAATESWAQSRPLAPQHYLQQWHIRDNSDAGALAKEEGFEDWMATYYAEHDPERANELLDEMGLARGADGKRMRPDGQPLVIDGTHPALDYLPYFDDLMTLLARYWTALGIGFEPKAIAYALWKELGEANELDAVSGPPTAAARCSVTPATRFACGRPGTGITAVRSLPTRGRSGTSPRARRGKSRRMRSRHCSTCPSSG